MFEDPVSRKEGELLIRAHKVLGLIVAEFDSDPMSVQCFDLRTVQEAKDTVKAIKEWNE